MALAYVKEDLKKFIRDRNIEDLPDDFKWVLFPMRGHQPPPFEKGISSEESSDYDDPTPEEKLTVYTNEYRIWFYPLIFIGDLPFDEDYKRMIATTSFVIGPLSGENSNLKRVMKNNTSTVDLISKRYANVLKDGRITYPSLGEVAALERYRTLSEAKERLRSLKRTYPEIFGETTETVDSFRETPKLVRSKSKREMFKEKVKRISPTISKKFKKKV
jgi:hypothetical protein